MSSVFNYINTYKLGGFKMNIKIDDKTIQVNDPSKNIVEIAEENGITITAPCFRNKKKHGCCNVCVVEADGKQAYACNLKAKDGMEIIYNREDLSQLRKEQLDRYAEAIKSGDTSQIVSVQYFVPLDLL